MSTLFHTSYEVCGSDGVGSTRGFGCFLGLYETASVFSSIVPSISSTLRGFRRFFGGSAMGSRSVGPPVSSMAKSSASLFSLTIPLTN